MSLENIRLIAGNESHSLAVNNVGHVYTWGSTANGKLGHGEYNPRANVTGREPRPKYVIHCNAHQWLAAVLLCCEALTD
jgi:alpha-tubulin suppressor-like RCC1 family protein